MAIYELEPYPQELHALTLNEALEPSTVLQTYNYDMLNVRTRERVPLRVEVVNSSDPRVDKAHEIEVAAMVALGDPEHEVREEFAPYRDKSLYFLAFDKDSAGTADEILGMGRIIPSNETDGNKSLLDLAKIPGWAINDEFTTTTGETFHYPEEVIAAFKAESGCDSLDKVWDIATLGMQLVKNAIIAEALIASFTRETVREARAGNLTHVTSFNQVHADKYFRSLGYPFNDMFGLGPMMYDSFDSGEGMTAQPAWLSTEDLLQTIRESAKSHMRRVVTRAVVEKA
jgi:hypothetical protein